MEKLYVTEYDAIEGTSTVREFTKEEYAQHEKDQAYIQETRQKADEEKAAREAMIVKLQALGMKEQEIQAFFNPSNL